ncbi:MAG: TadE family protein [Candidatus Dormibacteraceae bacterium]
MRSSSGASGQALIETAITLPLLFTFMLGFLALLIRIEAQVEIDTATSLAAASCVLARVGSPDCHTFAQDTYRGTLQHYSYLEIDGGGNGLNCPNTYQAGQTVVCNARATLRYDQTPMAYVVLINLPIVSQATTVGSAFRTT